MKQPMSRRQCRRGMALVEVLIAGFILSIALMGMCSLWSFTQVLTIRTDDTGIAYNLGRQAVEQVKMAGFAGAPEGTAVTYFDGNQATSTQQAARFRVTCSITSNLVKSGTSGAAGAVPADNALRTVSVTVTQLPTGQVAYQTQTFLVRAGI